MEAWLFMTELVSLLGLALLLGLVARRLRQMAILGYLLAGVLAGPKGLGLVQNQVTVQFLAELGVALLLFSIGLEFSWQRIGALGRASVWAGILQFLLTWTAGACAGWMLGLGIPGMFVLGSIVALSSTAFVLRILQDRTELDSRHGRLSVGILLLQDLLLIPLLVIQSVLAQGASGWSGVVEVGVQLGKGALLLAVFYVAVRLIVLRAFRGADTYAEREVPVILSVFVCVGCAWASHVAGLSPVLGAFIAGVLLADQPVADQVRANVMPLRAVFVTLFFASIGMLAGVPQGSQLGLVLLVAGVVVVGKALLGGIAIRAGGSPLRVAVLGGLAVAQIGEFSFVLAQDALQRKLLPADWIDPLVSASVATLIVTPYLFPLGQWLVNRVLGRGSAEGGEGAPEEVDSIVVGYGPAGREVVRDLLAAGRTVTVIESNPVLVKNVDGPRVLVGDGSNTDLLAHAGVDRARALIITVPDPGVARTILRIARGLAPDLPVLVRARYHRYAGPLGRLGAETVVDEEFLVGQALARIARQRLGIAPAE